MRLCLLVFLFLFVNCEQEQKFTYKIIGNLESEKKIINGRVFLSKLKENSLDLEVVDTAVLNENSFFFSGEFDGFQVAYIEIEGVREKFTIVLEPQIELKFVDFEAGNWIYNVNKGEETKLIKAYNDSALVIRRRISAFQKRFTSELIDKEVKLMKKDSLRRVNLAMFLEYDRLAIKQIEKYPNSYVSFMLVKDILKRPIKLEEKKVLLNWYKSFCSKENVSLNIFDKEEVCVALDSLFKT